MVENTAGNNTSSPVGTTLSFPSSRAAESNGEWSVVSGEFVRRESSVVSREFVNRVFVNRESRVRES